MKGLYERDTRSDARAAQATREKFAEYITVLKEALRDGAEASAAHTAGISLLQPEAGPAAAHSTPGADCRSLHNYIAFAAAVAKLLLQSNMHALLGSAAFCSSCMLRRSACALS